jgi:hypothetical protein
LQDIGGPSLPHARSEFDQAVGELLLGKRSELRRRWISLEQIEHSRVIQMRAHRAFQRWMDLCQQAAYAIAG